MPVAYNPAHFWKVCLTIRGSILPAVLPRSIAVFPCSLGAYLLNHHVSSFKDEALDHGIDLENLVIPVATIVSLLLAFRINDSFSKWSRAAQIVSDLHANARLTMALLIAYAHPMDEKLLKDLERIRRHLVLACVLIRKHVHGERSFDKEKSWGAGLG
jgi:predicted membrane chloride channel (bestrophin family)